MVTLLLRATKSVIVVMPVTATIHVVFLLMLARAFHASLIPQQTLNAGTVCLSVRIN